MSSHGDGAASMPERVRSIAESIVDTSTEEGRYLLKVADVLDGYEEPANLMLDALMMIRDEAGQPLEGLPGIKDQSWCAGVAMSCIEAVGERARALKQRYEREHVPRFLPRHLGGEADRVDGPGANLGGGSHV